MTQQPWHVDNKILVVERFDGDLTPDDYGFSRVMFWVHVMNLPFKFMNLTVARDVGAKLGRYITADVDSDAEAWGKSLRVRAEIDITKPLRRGVVIRLNNGLERWAELKYERLPNFLFHCGIIGHRLKDWAKHRA